jgi:hypothetical protein
MLPLFRAQLLNKKEFFAVQASRRGGEIVCRLRMPA